MNAAALAAEFPPDWLQHVPPAALDAVARATAVRIGRELLTDDGAGSWDYEVRDMLRASTSPTVRALADRLPQAFERAGKNWTADTVAAPVCAALGLSGEGIRRTVADAIRVDV